MPASDGYGSRGGSEGPHGAPAAASAAAHGVAPEPPTIRRSTAAAHGGIGAAPLLGGASAGGRPATSAGAPGSAAREGRIGLAAAAAPAPAAAASAKGSPQSSMEGAPPSVTMALHFIVSQLDRISGQLASLDSRMTAAERKIGGGRTGGAGAGAGSGAAE